MNWLILVLIAVFADAIRIFIDNYISDVYFKGRDSAAQKFYYIYVQIFIGILLLLIFRPDFSNVPFFVPLLCLASGFLAVYAGLPYYRALEIDDSTNVGIFIQLAPIIYLVLGWIFLGESFSFSQLISFAIILAAPLLIILTTRKRSRKIKLKAALYAALYVLIAVVANLIFVKAEEFNFGFLESIAFIYLGKGFGNLIIILTHKKLRTRFKIIMKKSRRRILIPLMINSVISFIKELSYRGALILAPAVALASVASDSAVPIVIFFLGVVLTLIWPRFGREKLNKKSVLIHLVATVLVVVGIIVMQL